MKKLVLLLFSFIACCTFSQGNLQFNKVITYENSGTWTAGVLDFSSPVYTVPAGKVWKIEYINLRRSQVGTNPQQAQLLIDGKNIYDNFQSQSVPVSGGMINSEIRCPLWMEAGSSIQANFTGGNQNVSYPASFFFSIIEFNLVP
jgi:hypothetical protein